MRWTKFFLLLGIGLLYSTSPLIISKIGYFLATKMYGCTERRSNASLLVHIKLVCGGNERLTDYWEQTISMDILAILTVPTGLLAICLLVVVQVISLLLKFARNRNRRSN